MSTRGATILLWLFVINLGIAFGAGLYEHRIVVPRWVAAGDAGGHWNAEQARRDDTGLRFWACVTTGPLTVLAGGPGCSILSRPCPPPASPPAAVAKACPPPIDTI